MPRIVSLIASATEIACALGFEDQLVGRSHECDYPPSVTRLAVCTAPRFDIQGNSRDIDERVKATLQDATSVYRVFEDVLKQLRPDVILTQTQCEVCAVSQKDVERALGDWLEAPPAIVSLSPNCLADVWADIQRVADALGAPQRGRHLIAQLQAQIATIGERARSAKRKPTVACLEWLDPLMAAGNWMPELVEMAGGVNLFGAAGKHSPWMSWEDLLASDPDVIFALPCGFDLETTRAEMAVLRNHPRWDHLKAVREGHVVITDGNQYFNRPGPRLVESLEIVAEVLHPALFHFGHQGTGWEGERCG
jgi:iron complex transport system substrate-binding protein